jgi:cytochrome P450
LNSQRSENELINALRDQLNTLPTSSYTINLTQFIMPFIRPFLQRKNTERMNSYISKILEERYATYDPSLPKRKSILDLALESYFEWQREQGMTGSTTIDETFKEYAIDQVKIFIFAGHDTTSSTICYASHLLAKHPVKLAKLRAEHDAVFGPDPARAAQQIRDKPHLINSLPYTTAVIRETMRTYAPASSTRVGEPGFFVKDPATGRPLPTDGFMVWPMANAMHRSPALWGPDAGDFVPERFLAENAASLPKHAFRPFEMGPRNCIGQELAMIEARLALVLTAREFDFHVTYDLDDVRSLRNDGSVWSRDKSLQYKGGSYKGDQAFPVLIATAKPNEGMPARATRRKHVAV